MDMEKVIKEFEHLLNSAKGNYQDFVDLTVDGAEEILTLLKEQEAEPELEGGGNSWWYVCSECHGIISDYDLFCKHCGAKIKRTVK